MITRLSDHMDAGSSDAAAAFGRCVDVSDPWDTIVLDVDPADFSSLGNYFLTKPVHISGEGYPLIVGAAGKDGSIILGAGLANMRVKGFRARQFKRLFTQELITGSYDNLLFQDLDIADCAEAAIHLSGACNRVRVRNCRVADINSLTDASAILIGNKDEHLADPLLGGNGVYDCDISNVSGTTGEIHGALIRGDNPQFIGGSIKNISGASVSCEGIYLSGPFGRISGVDMINAGTRSFITLKSLGPDRRTVIEGVKCEGSIPAGYVVDNYTDNASVIGCDFTGISALALMYNSQPSKQIWFEGNRGSDLVLRRIAYARGSGFRFRYNDFGIVDTLDGNFEGALLQGGGVDIMDVAMTDNKLFFPAAFVPTSAHAYRIRQNNVAIRDLLIGGNDTVAKAFPIIEFNASGDGERENWRVS